MAEGQSGSPAPAPAVAVEGVLVAMKGHPGSGKSTAARAIAATLRCPLLDKDDVRDCTLPLELAGAGIGGVPAAGMLNELSYAVLWRVAERQLRLGLSVVVDSPLSRRVHLDALARLPATLVVVVECRPGDEEEWRRRLEERGDALANSGCDGWHKPKTWAELERLVEGYQGCTDYDIRDAPRIVVDTTDPTVSVEAIAVRVVDFISFNGQCPPSVYECSSKFSVLDGFFYSKTRCAYYIARARALLRYVQARVIPSSNRKSYDVDSAIAVIQDGSVSLRVNTQHLRDISFRSNSIYQFIGELLIQPD